MVKIFESMEKVNPSKSKITSDIDDDEMQVDEQNQQRKPDE